MLGNQTFEVLQPLSKLSRQGLKVFKFVGMFSINKCGHNFKPGIPLSKDFRNDVIQMAAMRPTSEICRRYCINRSTVHKFTKQYRETDNIDPLSRKYFIVTLDENPHLRKAEAYFNRSGSVSSKKSLISILSSILVKRARTPFKLQMFGSQTCHVCTQLEHVFLSHVHT